MRAVAEHRALHTPSTPVQRDTTARYSSLFDSSMLENPRRAPLFEIRAARWAANGTASLTDLPGVCPFPSSKATPGL
jgi:hypothetical protein